MGLANLIPGVSGGTMAVITGIFDELVVSISQVFRLKKSGLKIIIFVGMGIIFSIFSGAKFFDFALSKFPFYMYSFFFGLILGSIVYLMRKISFKVFPIVLGILTVLIPNFLPHSSSISSLKILFGGFLGGAAMIVPGLSGSLMLLIMGIYDLAISAVSNLQYDVLVILGLGVLMGIYFVTQFLRWAIEKNKVFVDNFVLGLVIGSLYPIFPTFHGKGNVILGFLFAFGGYFISILIEKIDR
ncbi:MAG: DUF368 domain-containing protein [Thermosipho sp. (in: Bacteria)]|nr:DUF368 domain-containing protein [Thermosipho sp. (in: thermotogales)]